MLSIDQGNLTWHKHTLSPRMQAQESLCSMNHRHTNMGSLNQSTRRGTKPHSNLAACTAATMSFPSSTSSSRHFAAQRLYLTLRFNSSSSRGCRGAASSRIKRSSPVMAAGAAATAPQAVSSSSVNALSSSWTPCRVLAGWLQQAGGFVHSGRCNKTLVNAIQAWRNTAHDPPPPELSSIIA